EGKIVEAKVRFAVGRRDSEREHERALLASVADESRWIHVWGRSGSRFGFRRDTEFCLVLGQSQEVIGQDDLLDLLHARLVVWKNGVTGKLLFFQFADNIAILR